LNIGSGVSGTGNAGVGCKVEGMSQASFDDTLGAVTITGALGDAQAGTLAPQTWVSLSPAGASDNLNRIEPAV
jgi:hypothetical protein